MRYPKQAVYRRATQVGVSVTWGWVGSVLTIRVTAPAGYHWRDGGVHELKAEGRPTTARQRDELWCDVFDRMTAGLHACDVNRADCADWAAR